MLKDQSQLYSCGFGQKQKVSQHCLTPSQSHNSHTQYLLQPVHLYFDTNTDRAIPFESLLQLASCSSDSNGMAWSV